MALFHHSFPRGAGVLALNIQDSLKYYVNESRLMHVNQKILFQEYERQQLPE
jgi:hypothetical protein